MLRIYIRFFNSHLPSSSSGSILLRLSKTYRYPSWGNFGLTLLPTRLSAIYVIGYKRKWKKYFLMLRKTLPLSPKIQKYTQSPLKTNVQHLLPSFKKTVAILKNIRARWKTHSSRDNHVCVLRNIVIKQIALAQKRLSAKTVAPNGPIPRMDKLRPGIT